MPEPEAAGGNKRSRTVASIHALNPLPGFAAWLETQVMLGFVGTGNESLVSCLCAPQRAVAAYHELLRRGEDAAGAIRAGLHHENPAVREGCCRLLGKFVHTDGRAAPPWRWPTPRTRTRSSGRRQAGSRLAAPSTNGPSLAHPGNGTALENLSRIYAYRQLGNWTDHRLMPGQRAIFQGTRWRPQQDSNLRSRLRRPPLQSSELCHLPA